MVLATASGWWHVLVAKSSGADGWSAPRALSDERTGTVEQDDSQFSNAVCSSMLLNRSSIEPIMGGSTEVAVAVVGRLVFAMAAGFVIRPVATALLRSSVRRGLPVPLLLAAVGLLSMFRNRLILRAAAGAGSQVLYCGPALKDSSVVVLTGGGSAIP